jgi:hypothetical protein
MTSEHEKHEGQPDYAAMQQEVSSSKRDGRAVKGLRLY